MCFERNVLRMINDNIKRYRKEKGYSQEEMAVKLHVVRQTVSKWGKRPVCSRRGSADPYSGDSGCFCS